MPKDEDGIGIIAQDMKKIFPYMVSAYKGKLDEKDKKETNILNFDGSALRFCYDQCH